MRDHSPTDLAYVAVAAGFAYMALITDVWSRRVLDYAIDRRIDARLTVEALRRAIPLRRTLPGCVILSGRGTQYASEPYRALLKEHGLVSLINRRGNPYDKPQAESLETTLKVKDVAVGAPRFIEAYNDKRLHSARGYLSPAKLMDRYARTL